MILDKGEWIEDLEHIPKTVLFWILVAFDSLNILLLSLANFAQPQFFEEQRRIIFCREAMKEDLSAN